MLNQDGNYLHLPEGKAIKSKSFLRALVNFKYISSNFRNPRRLHPCHRQVRPHNGIDYGGPVGHPIMAAGSGSVVACRLQPVQRQLCLHQRTPATL